MGSVQDYHRLVEAVKATFHRVDAMVSDTTKLRAHLVKQIEAERRTEREIEDLEDTVRHVCLCCRSAALGGIGSRHDLLLKKLSRQRFQIAINMRKAGLFNLAESVFADVQDVDIGGRTV